MKLRNQLSQVGMGGGGGGWLDLLKLRLAKPVSRALAGAGLRKN